MKAGGGRVGQKSREEEMQLGVCCKVQGKCRERKLRGQQRPGHGWPPHKSHRSSVPSAAGDGKREEALHRRVARRDVPFRKLILAAAREN